MFSNKIERERIAYRSAYPQKKQPLLTLWYDVKIAFKAFLAVPTVIVLSFILLAILSAYLDQVSYTNVPWLHDLRLQMESVVFVNPEATGTFLAAVAGSLMTVTSIILSLVLLALQQSASSLTSQVYDQFMRRRINQVAIGFFIGLSLYALIILSMIGGRFNPVISVAIAFLGTGVALFLLPTLIYAVTQQIRSGNIIRSISELTASARDQQAGLLERTQRAPRSDLPSVTVVRADSVGFVDRVDLGPLESVLDQEANVEVVLLVSIGDYVTSGEPVADVRGEELSQERRNEIVEAAREALVLVPARNILHDPGYGLEQLGNIGWTAISPAKSSPAPALGVIKTLRRLFNQLKLEPEDEAEEEELPVVYRDDVMSDLFDIFESLAVSASESRQHQSVREIVHALAVMATVAEGELRERLVKVTRVILATLSAHVVTSSLSDSLLELKKATESMGESALSKEIEEAHRAALDVV